MTASQIRNKAFTEIQEMRVRSLGWEGPLEEEMATHSSVLAWRIPWTEEPPWGHKESAVSEGLNNSCSAWKQPESTLLRYSSLLTEAPLSLGLSGSFLTVPPLCSSHLFDAIFPL